MIKQPPVKDDDLAQSIDQLDSNISVSSFDLSDFEGLARSRCVDQFVYIK